jgi:outer membrane lipoprotein-sorting protein
MKKYFPILRRAYILFALLSILHGLSDAQVLRTIEVDFTRVYESSDAADTASGIIYYHEPDDLKLHTSSPVNQWMIFKENQLDIYYPDDQLVYRIYSQFPSSLPFFQALVGVVKEDYGLATMGYEMASYTSSGDTLQTTWNPPLMADKLLGPYRLNFVADKIIFAEISDAGGAITARSHYSDHRQFGTTWFPMTIKTIHYLEQDSTVETVTYSKAKMNEKLPQEITEFQIPDNAKIVETEW